MRYLIFGKNGQLGREFIKNLIQKEVLALSHGECDISDLSKVEEVFDSFRPHVVLNCAAYNMVDRAEEEYTQAYKTNALGVKNLCFCCKKFKSYFITYSTDYVFNGEKQDGLYTEEDKPSPLNEYGKSKLAGERWVEEEDLDNYIIFRTSWVYGDGKQNFISKILEWAKNREYLKIAYDEVSIPTSTKTIVNITLEALEQGIKGLYHLTNSGPASRYEWAKKVLEIKKIERFIYPVSKDIFNLSAKRPSFSAMSNNKIKKILNVDIPFWEEELKHTLSRLFS